MKLRSARLASLLALMNMPVTAYAAKSPGFELVWDAPPECNSRERVLAGVERLIGREPSQTKSPLTAIATVTVSEDGKWHLTLRMESEHESRTRQLHATTCPELSNAATLILALAIDPELAERRSESPVDVSPEPELEGLSAESKSPAGETRPAETAPVAAKPAPPDVLSLPQARQRLHVSAGLGPAVALGVVPPPAVGLVGAFSASHGRYRLELAATYLRQGRTYLADRRDWSGSLGLRSATLSACVAGLQRARFDLGLCGVVELGVIVGRGMGVRRPLRVTEPWGSIGLGSSLRIELHTALALRVMASAGVPWERTEFRLEDRPVFRPSPWVGAARLLLEARIF